MCPQKDNDYYFERPDVYLIEMFHSGIYIKNLIFIKKVDLFFLVIVGMLTATMFNLSGISITKYVSALQRYNKKLS